MTHNQHSHDLQDLTYSLHGAKAPGYRNWPFFTAHVLYSDGCVFDTRSSWDDCKLARWLESFGFFSLSRYAEESCN